MNEFAEGNPAADAENGQQQAYENSPGSNAVEKIGFFQSIKLRAWAGIFLLTLIPLLLLGGYAFNVLDDITKNILIEGNIQAFQQEDLQILDIGKPDALQLAESFLKGI